MKPNIMLDIPTLRLSQSMIWKEDESDICFLFRIMLAMVVISLLSWLIVVLDLNSLREFKGNGYSFWVFP